MADIEDDEALLAGRRHHNVHFETPWSPREATECLPFFPEDQKPQNLYAFFNCTAHRSSAERPPSPAGAEPRTDIVYIKVDIDGDVLPEPCGCMNATDETGDCEWEFCGYQHYINRGVWLPVYKILYFDTEGEYQYYLDNQYAHAFAASENPREDFHQVGQKQTLVKSASKQ